MVVLVVVLLMLISVDGFSCSGGVMVWMWWCSCNVSCVIGWGDGLVVMGWL